MRPLGDPFGNASTEIWFPLLTPPIVSGVDKLLVIDQGTAHVTVAVPLALTGKFPPAPPPLLTDPKDTGEAVIVHGAATVPETVTVPPVVAANAVVASIVIAAAASADFLNFI